MFKFGSGSLEKLETVHPDLKLVMNEVIKLTPIDFGITEGMRILDIKIRWGGSWVTGDFKLNRDMSFIDAVHFEIIE